MPRHVIPMIITMIFLASPLIALTCLIPQDLMGAQMSYLRVNPCGGRFSIQVASGLAFGRKFPLKILMMVPQVARLETINRVFWMWWYLMWIIEKMIQPDIQLEILAWAWMVIIIGPIKVQPMQIMMVWVLTMVLLRLSVQPLTIVAAFGVITLINLAVPWLHLLILTSQVIWLWELIITPTMTPSAQAPLIFQLWCKMLNLQARLMQIMQA